MAKKRFALGDSLWLQYKSESAKEILRIPVTVIQVTPKAYRVKFQDRELIKSVPEQFYFKLSRR